MLKIAFLDGVSSVGGTKIWLFSKDTGIFLDFGVNFKKWTDYYEEFLKPRSSRGIVDLLGLGIVPPLKGIYREDLFPEGYQPKLSWDLEVRAVFTTHAHLDHAGHIGLLSPKIPVYASTMTSIILKAMEDSGRVDFDREVAYFSSRSPLLDDPRVLVAERQRCYQGRKFFLVDRERVEKEVIDFWHSVPRKNKFLLSPTPEGGKGRVGRIKYLSFEVDHSIYGTTAYLFETEEGWVVYTGDFRRHGFRGEKTEIFLKEIMKIRPFLLLIEGTNLKERKRYSEEDVYSQCLEAVGKNREKITIADFSPRNVERLLTFLRIARESSKILVILARDAYLLEKMKLVERGLSHIFEEKNLLIFDDPKGRREGWEEEIREKYRSIFISPREISQSEGSFILAFSFWDIKHLLDIQPHPGGIYIYSSSEAFTEEQKFDFKRLKNWLDFFQIHPVGFSLVERGDSLKCEFTPGYHASGHIYREELFEIIRETKPHWLIPIHTENPRVFVENLKDSVRVILPREGEVISFSRGNIELRKTLGKN